MTKPASVPEWATDATHISGPETGLAPTSEPAAGYKTQGFVAEQNFVGRYLNWWMKLVYQWILYLRDLHTEVDFLNKTYSWTASHAFTAGLTGTTVAVSGNISTSGGTVTAQNGVVATTGGVTATAGGVTATAGGVTATAGGVTATTGDIQASAGHVIAGASSDHKYTAVKTIAKILPSENGRPYGTTQTLDHGTYWTHYAYTGADPDQKDGWACSAVDAVDRPWLIFPVEGIPDGATVTKVEVDVYHAGGASDTGAVYFQRVTPATGAFADSDTLDTVVIADGAGPVAVATRATINISRSVDPDAHRYRIVVKPPRNVVLGVGAAIVTYTTDKVTNDTQ